MNIHCPDGGALDSDSDEGPNPLVMPVEDLSGDEYFAPDDHAAAHGVDGPGSSDQETQIQIKVHACMQLRRIFRKKKPHVP